jgi:hypothetical protein
MRESLFIFEVVIFFITEAIAQIQLPFFNCETETVNTSCELAQKLVYKYKNSQGCESPSF